ncbi:hypothetical protein AJ78_07951 [Emergomyces pasteurianus Ep9510]|uniref:Uncharacterized protein n=1 Tax=Emergomyces pasteurianus Ep9510 TaxID=1447872 RepID=A0A1J9Q5N0_9EURO|nr:hypothetical protein AJ78_07951 [Emergomyces pasteurianus Ep9510]
MKNLRNPSSLEGFEKLVEKESHEIDKTMRLSGLTLFPEPLFQGTTHGGKGGTARQTKLPIRLGFKDYSLTDGWIYNTLTSCRSCDFCAFGYGFQFANVSGFVDLWLRNHSNLDVIPTLFNMFNVLDQEEHDIMWRIVQCVCRFLERTRMSCALEAALQLAILTGALSQIPLIRDVDQECCHVTRSVHEAIFRRIQKLEVTVFGEADSILQFEMWKEQGISGTCFLLLLVISINAAYDSLDAHRRETDGVHMARTTRRVFGAFDSVLSDEGIFGQLGTRQMEKHELDLVDELFKLREPAPFSHLCIFPLLLAKVISAHHPTPHLVRSRNSAPETGSADRRGGSGMASVPEKNNRIDQGTNMAEKVQHLGDQQQQSSSEFQESVTLDSTSSTRPTSPVPATQLWEAAAHGSVRCEETATGQAIHITLSSYPLSLQPSKVVPDWARSIHTALAENQSATPFQQMYRPLSQEDKRYIRKRLEDYTDEARRHIHKLDGFDCAVILADARTLFSNMVLLESTIKSQRTETPSKKRTMRSAGPAGQENCGKRQRRL